MRSSGRVHVCFFARASAGTLKRRHWRPVLRGLSCNLTLPCEKIPTPEFQAPIGPHCGNARNEVDNTNTHIRKHSQAHTHTHADPEMAKDNSSANGKFRQRGFLGHRCCIQQHAHGTRTLAGAEFHLLLELAAHLCWSEESIDDLPFTRAVVPPQSSPPNLVSMAARIADKRFLVARPRAKPKPA